MDELDQDVRIIFDRLRARVLTLVDATAIPEDQKLAIKALIKNLSYQAQSDLQEII